MIKLSLLFIKNYLFNNRLFARFYSLLCVILFMLFFVSCEKDKDNDSQPKDYQELNEEQISAIVEGSNVVSTQVQSFLMTSLVVAADSGYSTETPPDVSSIPGNNFNLLKAALEGWTGPDANGWYTLYMSGVYNYTEKVRLGDTIEHIIIMEYHGGDGSFSNTTTTKYMPYLKDSKKLYKGYSIWEVEASGYNDISRTEWRIEFEDWNAETGAGIYDWYWGVSENSGGNTVPLHRYEHLEATETTTEGWLHCRIICYDDSGTETWDFEYDTPWVPVVMPEIPNFSVN